jgi:lipopolysaccharide export system permease protein
MGSIGRYIFRTTIAAFVLTLVSLTLIIWVTQALREIDLVTNQKQTVLTFIGITSLTIPFLMVIIIPVAFALAVAHVLNKLTTDSEIIVMSSAGMSPWGVFKGFLAAGISAAILAATLSIYISPLCLRELRRAASQARADFVTNIVQPGRFTTIEPGLIFHIRDRQPNGLLLGVFLNDQRDPKEQVTFLAEEGVIVQNPEGTFLVLDTGTTQRRTPDQTDPTIVHYDRYAFDLSRFANTNQSVAYTAREREIWDLAAPDPKDPVFNRSPNQFRTELNDRLLAPLFPIAFAILGFAYLGSPRTTRQSRALAMAGLIAAASLVRVLCFAGIVASMQTPIALVIPYLTIGLATVFGVIVIARGNVISLPQVAEDWVAAVVQRFSRRFVPQQ